LAIKSWFRGGGGGEKQPQQEYTIDDLIVLERYEEAEEHLRAKLKLNPQDLHSHLKLAEVYAQLRQFDRAVGEFGYVADEYSQDGFYDKAVALLSKAQKLAPMDQSLRFRIERIQREKSMEHVRAVAIEGLRQAGGLQAGTSAIELKRLWHNLATSTVVQHLPGEQLKRLFASMQHVQLKDKEVLVEEGSSDAWLLLVVNGVIEAYVAPAGGREMAIRSFGSGDIVGEGALLEHAPWPSGLRVTEPGSALKLTREGLEKTLMGNPDPRGFLEVLREQHNDRDVGATLRRMRGL
jgi:hypothetical protein